nr:hypothetical protein GCM10017745_23760 [Saccharothrix mutabilis subsp. capreolus]
MIPLSLAEIADAVGGTLHGTDGTPVVTGAVEFDTRKVAPGGLFLALPGERVDGHDFAAQAVARARRASWPVARWTASRPSSHPPSRRGTATPTCCPGTRTARARRCWRPWPSSPATSWTASRTSP